MSAPANFDNRHTPDRGVPRMHRVAAFAAFRVPLRVHVAVNFANFRIGTAL
jgi:hypothetical protein